MTDDRGLSGATWPVGDLGRTGHWSARGRFAGWAVVAALSVTLAVVPMDPSSANSSPLGKVSIITGPVSACGGGPFNGLPRTFVVTLHERPGGHVVATYTLRPSKHLNYFAFAVGLGTYFLTTSEATSPPPRGNIVVRTTSKDIIEATISTVCQ